MASGRKRLYSIWNGMKIRCYNDKCERYYRYGGRGIKICDKWRNDFQSFYDWSMDHGYSDDLTIDRINNDGNYEPGNCRWATLQEQQHNKSNNIFITYNGKTQDIKQWAEELGIYYQTLYFRIISGWPVEKAFFEPVKESVRNRYPEVVCLPGENRSKKVHEYKRRLAGIQTREERLSADHEKVMAKVDILRKALNDNPGISSRKIASVTGIPRTTAQRLMKEYIDK